MARIARDLGVKIKIDGDHALVIKAERFSKNQIPLAIGAKMRTSFMMIVPLLLRTKKALIPNPGGCRIGARPMERHIEGLSKMGAKIQYHSDDGYFHSHLDSFSGKKIVFPKNTHTGTETLILAAVLAKGKTILENAASEPEVDDLIKLLNQMGARIKRTKARTIEIHGVPRLSGTTFRIMPDRNEVVTLAVAALVTRGDILVSGARRKDLISFLKKLDEAGGGWSQEKEGIRFFYQKRLRGVDIKTSPHPGFMTDWQAPWALLMTQATGQSIIYETVYENRFQYVSELLKMGAKIAAFNPKVSDPTTFYNFNPEDDRPEYFHALKIFGPTRLHNAILSIPDLRAGATLVLAALAAPGESSLSGIETLYRGYEKLDYRLRILGAKIKKSA
jgi:UDP-N-acetylglucosamine 1-carboxyvinyltransferase